MDRLQRGKKKIALLLSFLLVLTGIPAGTMETAAKEESTVSGNSAEDAQSVSGNNSGNSENGDQPETFYSITVSGSDLGGTVIVTDEKDETVDDGLNIPEGESRTVVGTPNAGYEVTGVSAKKSDSEWKPDGSGDGEWWKTYIKGDIFALPIESVDADYDFEVEFDKKRIVISYKLSANGKLTLNSDSQDAGNIIVLEAGEIEKEGTQEIAYTTEAYHVTAGLTDESYHVTSFLIDDQEIVEAEKINNDLNSVEYVFESGITQEHSIQVTVAKDEYIISVAVQEGQGTVTLQDGTALTDSSAVVESGEDITFSVKPEQDWQISEITIDGTNVSPGECTSQPDGSYDYTISAVKADKNLSVSFSEIPSEIKSLQDSGLLLKNEDGDEPTLEAGNVCYAEQFTLTEKTGLWLRLDMNSPYAASVTVDDTGAEGAAVKLTAVYLREENPTAFGGEKKIVMNPSISMIADAESPFLAFTEEEQTIYKPGTETIVEITGKIQDKNPDRIVWSETSLDKEAVLAETVNVTRDFQTTDGRFTIENLGLQDSVDEDAFYLYAVDKAGNCSAENIVKVLRDGTGPEITQLEISPEIESYDFGNFFNTAIKLKLTASDVTQNNTAQCQASGINSIRVYAGDALDPICEETVQERVTGDTEAVIEVTIPVGEEEAFSSLKEVKIIAIDYVGNSSQEYTLTSIANHPGDVKSNSLMLENVKPVIQVEAQSDYVQEEGGNKYYWYKEIPQVTYHVSEETKTADGQILTGSGILKRSAILNDVEISSFSKTDYTDSVTDYSKIVRSENGTLDENMLSGMVEGENTLILEFQDIAGNKGESIQTLYLDTKEPAVTGFSIELEKADNLMDAVLNMLPFGNFSNSEVKITVTAQDNLDDKNQQIPSSGLDTITLYLDEEAYQTAAVTEGKAVFTLPGSEVLKAQGKVYLDKRIKASAADHVGNVSAVCEMTTGNSNLESSRLMIETVKPVIEVTASREDYVSENGSIFNSADTSFAVKAIDSDSGLSSVRIDINGTVLAEENFGGREAVPAKEYTVSTADAAETPEGIYVVTVTAVDNAGNEVQAVRQIYKDETSPQILRYDMEASGVSEADGTVLSYEETDYGYYFLEDTKVTVYATDGSRPGDAGVKEIRYYTVDETGVQSPVSTLLADAEEKISFVIPAGFKGQIYACAFDWLDNSTQQYLSPSRLIVETPQQHAAEEHILFQKTDAPYTDSNGGELYSGDVTVNVTVEDTFSGIRSVEWSVNAPYDSAANQGGSLQIDNGGQFTQGSSTEGWTSTQTEKNLVTQLQRSFVVSANSNDISLRIVMTDRAGNTSEREIRFSIDKTSPAIEITFDNMSADGENARMYQADRVATIVVTERNFNPSDFTASITNTDGDIPGISAWSTAVNSENPDQTTNTATVTFSQDGDYTLEVSGRDRAGNAAETVRAEDFTIDKTRPVITVAFDNEDPINGNYFAAQRTATIRIEEHNFSQSRVTINGTFLGDDGTSAFPAIGGWSQNGDVYTTSLVCGVDGLYRFDIECTDMAGNEGELYTGEEYYVDTQKPVVSIDVKTVNGKEENVAPIITMTDANYNYDRSAVSIELSGANSGSTQLDGAYANTPDGQTYTFENFPVRKEFDDLYTLSVRLTDMAGNESDVEPTVFSVNRFGSVYILDKSLTEILGRYVQEGIDVKLSEINVNSLDLENIRVVVDKNGTPRDLEKNEYTVAASGGNGSWYQYDYTIDKSLFSEDGRYIVTLYSQDEAENINENAAEDKAAEISFGVDGTDPVVIPVDIESGEQYPEVQKQATVAVSDNLVLQNVEILLNGEVCEYVAEGDNYIFEIPSSNTPQEIIIQASDAAGNHTEYVISQVLVTTNLFSRWYYNKPLFILTLVGAGAVTAGGIGGVAAFRSGRIRVKRKK